MSSAASTDHLQDTLTSQAAGGSSRTLHQLAQAAGIHLAYNDVWGNHHQVSDDSLRHLLTAMGYNVSTLHDIDQSFLTLQEAPWKSCLDPVIILSDRDEHVPVTVRFPQGQAGQVLSWVIEEEHGFVHQGELTLPTEPNDSTVLFSGHALEAFQLTLPVVLPLGYHTLTVHLKKDPASNPQTSVVVTPTQCYLPQGFLNTERPLKTWGPAVQLYALQSRHNWGIGDFTDLAMLVDWCGKNHAGLVGLNPLHALFSHNPGHISPYSPSSRTFYNMIYLDIEAIEDFAQCPKAQERLKSNEAQDLIEQSRKSVLIQYEPVHALKLELLVYLYETFEQAHLTPNTARGQAFKAFVETEGAALKQFALYEALQDDFYAQDQTLWGWPVWPAAYQNAQSAEVKAFEAQNTSKINLFLYIQWQLHSQLSTIEAQTKALQLPVGLYMDLAVGVDKGGVDTWANPSLYAMDINVGCPPDELNQKGQNWGLPPMIPHVLRNQAYRPFIDLLRNNMRYAGALRLDHAMALMRLFWIPSSCQTAADGAYITYPLDELLSILALESHRNQCLVIGEDLGTVPDEFRVHMDERRILSYKVFFFERLSDTDFRPADQYPKQALVTTSTHDIPTLKGYWLGEDLKVRDQLHLYPNEDMRTRLIEDRAVAKQGILNLLAQNQLLPDGVSQHAPEVRDVSYPLNLAVHRFLSQSPAYIQMIQLEDVLEQVEQANMPGTVNEHPNWRRKLNAPLEMLFVDPRMNQMSQTCQQGRSSDV